jgi:hypothetical protein
MSDHAILGVLVVLSIAIGIGGLLILGLVLGAMLRESQRLTRAVAGLVYQESEKTRGTITGRPPA